MQQMHSLFHLCLEFLFRNRNMNKQSSVISVSSSGFVRARGSADIRDVNANSENWAVVKAALVAGMYPNLVHVDRENLVLTGPEEKKVRFHPTSVLSQAQYKKVINITLVFMNCRFKNILSKLRKI